MNDTTVCAGRQPIRLTASQEKKLFGGRTPKYIGQGKDACAYKVNGDVVKFTGNAQDAAASVALARKPVRGVVRIQGVARVSDWPGGPWAVKSKFVPRPGPLTELARGCAVQGHMDNLWAERFTRAQKDPRVLSRAMPVPKSVVACILVRAPSARIAPGKAVKFLRELSDTQVRLARATGIHWGDTSSFGNISEENGKPVIIDLGSSVVPRRYFEALERTPELAGVAASGSVGVMLLGAAAVAAALVLAAVAGGGVR